MAREARRRKIPTISNLELCQLQFQIWELWIRSIGPEQFQFGIVMDLPES